MKIVIFISFTLSYLLILSSHPMVMISLISAQALMVCMILLLTLSNSWFSFILFLVFMGGLMVLFIYVSSLASNESISLPLLWDPKNFTPMIILSLMFFSISLNTQIFNNPSLVTNLSLIFSVYSPNMMFLTGMIMLYLLLTLIIIVKVTTLKEGSLRNLK